MPFGRCWIGRRVLFGLAAVLALGAASAQATPYLVVDADSDQVLMQNEATAPWYPASLTKLMTVYVALDAVRNGKLTLDTPLIMSARAARMPPSKMGFRPGTQVTLDNALKMLMVKSPNDVAVMVAEGVSGSVEAFADDMNADAQRLGMHESHFVNPNGLHNPDHVSSARDMAIVARALLREFPDHADLFSIGAIQLGNQYIPNHNGLLGRYPGADGMKTGFTCPGGFQCGGERQPLRAASDRGRARGAVGEIAQSRGGRPLRPRLRQRRGQWLVGIAAVGLGRARPACERVPASQRRRARRAPKMTALLSRLRLLRDQRDAAGCSPSPWRRFLPQPSRTPNSPMKGSGSIRCRSTLVPRPGGRGPRWAPVGRQPKRQPRRGGPRPYPLTIRPQPRRRLKETQAGPSRLRPDPSTSRRGIPGKAWRRTNLQRARPENWRRRTYPPTEFEIGGLNPKLMPKVFNYL